MSEKLIVEFYEQTSTSPVATVLSIHGGDNPVSAALTLCDFLNQISKLDRSDFNDAGLLAARFIIWHATHVDGPRGLEISDVMLIQNAKDYGYQTARVHALQERPYVEIVEDQYSTAEELESAAFLLRQSNVGCLSTQ